MSGKDLDYYLNLNWTLLEGEDLDFDGNPYHYIEIKYCEDFFLLHKTKQTTIKQSIFFA